MPESSRQGGADDSAFGALLEAIQDYGICMINPAGKIASWNAAAERLTGYELGEVTEKHFSITYPDEERDVGSPNLALTTAANQGRFEREGWLLRKDGSRFWGHLAIYPIRSPQGELSGYAEVMRDLTGRRAAQEFLHKTEEQFRLLVQGVTDYAVFMLDPDGRVVSWNAGAERIKGYTEHEIVGQHFSRFYTEEERQIGVPEEGLATARREGRWEREGLRVRKDGRTFWAHVVIDAIRGDDGAILGFAKITRDITERKLAQSELEKAREALFQSQKLEALGQLTGGIAHDFNNLLMAAMSGVELLRRRMPRDARVETLLDSTLDALKRGAALTERMLAFARRQELELRPINVQNLVRGLHNFLQRSIGPGVRVTSDIPGNLPAAYTDSNQLENALLNLTLNARDAMPDGGLVTISARVAPGSMGDPTLAPGEYVVIAVSDTGVGMDAQTVARAAEPFFSTKGAGKGTGLGLSMVHGLARQSGGALTIRSRVGKGTTVELWLPVSTEEVAPLPQPAIARSECEGRELLVLLVDDDPLVLTATAALLDDLGHYVLTAASGEEAVKAVEANDDIDIVITDFAMPHMNGLDLARNIRCKLPDVPIVIASGYADATIPEEPRLWQIKKPFSQERLRAILYDAAQ